VNAMRRCAAIRSNECVMHCTRAFTDQLGRAGDQPPRHHNPIKQAFRCGAFSKVSAGIIGRLMSASARKRPGAGLKVAIGQSSVIQTPKLGARIMRYELADYEWAAIKLMLPNKPRGVPRVNDRRVLGGIFWALRSGSFDPIRNVPPGIQTISGCCPYLTLSVLSSTIVP
jgi:hypothetical protein